MKIIKLNEIKIESLPETVKKTSLLDAIKDFVKIDEKHIQYVKCQRDDELLKCSMHPFVQAIHLAYSHHVPLTFLTKFSAHFSFSNVMVLYSNEIFIF